MSTSRRHFLRTVTASALAAPLLAQEKPVDPKTDTTLLTNTPAKLKVGLDNFAVRAMGWKGAPLLDFAASLKCDTLLISDLSSFGSLENAALKELKAKADDLGLELYAGSWSICPSSPRFKKDWGTAEEHLRLGLRVAKTIGSPVFRVILGSMEDRKTPGGIQARIADTVKVLKACRQEALDAGVKVAVENHAGDLHSWELKALIEQAGPDFVGANIDSGNAAWTLEDPLDVLETLGPLVICSSLRDNMIWEIPEGAAVQWTAVGEGLIDWKKFTARWRALCPAVPIIVETISGFSKPFPYKKEEFWQDYDKRPDRLANFEALAKRGQPVPPFKAPDGADKATAERDFQKGDITRSIRYLRETLGLGLKA